MSGKRAKYLRKFCAEFGADKTAYRQLKKLWTRENIQEKDLQKWLTFFTEMKLRKSRKPYPDPLARVLKNI